MPHVALVPFTGLRVREDEMFRFGMTLPGIRQRADAVGNLPALGMLTLAGMLPPDWSCSYHPSGATDNLLDDVLRTEPTIVAVSALTASVLDAYTLCGLLKNHHVPTVIGGLHATALPEEAARHASSVCVGDGESNWLQILSDGKSGNLRRIYRPEQPFDLTCSPLPRFDLLKGRSIQRWTVQTQRGCPWSCEFCGASRVLGPLRFKPPQRIHDELDSIRQLDPTPWVELADDNTLAGRSDAEAMLREIESAGIRYFTESDWRIGQDRRLTTALATSGCVQVLVGFESLAFRYPGMGKKRADLARIRDAVDLIQDAGIAVNGCFIVGADGETNESLDRLIEFVNRSSLAEIQITVQTPFPGTMLYHRIQQEGRLIRDRDWSYYTLFDVVFQPDTMSVTELEHGFRRVMSSVFSEESFRHRSSIRRRVWSKHPSIRGLRS
jgi:radical SAM superfamily enzyme YgiQ (UPF0313 family)